ncbi:MAG: HAD family phosphatase [Myxococcota bacterium]|nr:HAD family phosphatase [Myxococcota bacterium]
MTIQAVIFDLGGVVLGSPMHAIAEYEKELGLPENFVNRVVARTAPTGAWSRLERGEIAMETFYGEFESDCAEAGPDFSAREMMRRMGEVTVPRPIMLKAIESLRTAGMKVAALTNNWASDEATGQDDGTRALTGFFDVFVESSVEGLRKPDPRIYELVCERLSISPSEAVFLDDIGYNLKAARAMGMQTIKVVTPEQALGELAAILDLPLLD